METIDQNSVVAVPANPYAAFTVAGAVQKSLTHLETKALPVLETWQPVAVPAQPLKVRVEVEGANTPTFIGYWFGTKGYGEKHIAFDIIARDENELKQRLWNLKQYALRSGVRFTADADFDLHPYFQ